MLERCLITGANGFIGQALSCHLLAKGWRVRGAVRAIKDQGGDLVAVGDIDAETNWAAALQDVSVVVHAAARVHVMNERAPDALDAFRLVNRDATLNLARQAMAAGVKRFIFISSIKVNGERTVEGKPFRADDPVAPGDPYGLSKWEAEQGLHALCKSGPMELVIVRPPLVYGPGAGANFGALMRLVRSGLPLPLGGIANRRSLVALGNLVDLLHCCMTHPAASGRTLLVRDGENLSIAALIRHLARAMDRPPRLFSVPGFFLKGAALALGKGEVYRRLADSLEVDDEPTRVLLGWAPPLSVEDAMRRVVQAKELGSC